MRGLSEHDRQEVRALARELSVIDLDAPSIGDAFADRLASVLRTETALVYSVRYVDAEPRLTRCSLGGAHKPRARAIRAGLQDWARETDAVCGFTNFRMPDAAHRNRVVDCGSVRQISDEGRIHPVLAPLRLPRDEYDRRVRAAGALVPYARQWGVADANQLRVQVCEGPVLLAWVGGLQHEPFAPRAHRLLSALVPAIRRRLGIEDRLACDAASPLVPALLEQIGSPAYLLDGSDSVVAASSAGERVLARDRRRHRERLRTARRSSGDARFIAVELAARGVPRYALLIERASGEVPEAAVRAARARFGLTPREADVLARVARGDTNRAISVALGCSERTVETHVSRILAKTDCATRSAVVSLLFALVRE